MATNDNIFVLDDGTKELTITNPFGEVICTVHIRPGDISILDRYNDLLKDFDQMVAPIANMDIKNDGTSSRSKDWEIIKQVEENLIERINFIFDSKDASNLFKNRNAFSTINGEFYAEKVIDMLGNVVAKEIEVETKKSAERLKKYTKDIDDAKDEEK